MVPLSELPSPVSTLPNEPTVPVTGESPGNVAPSPVPAVLTVFPRVETVRPSRLVTGARTPPGADELGVGDGDVATVGETDTTGFVVTGFVATVLGLVVPGDVSPVRLIVAPLLVPAVDTDDTPFPPPVVDGVTTVDGVVVDVPLPL
jgi:hypothetical protein